MYGYLHVMKLNKNNEAVCIVSDIISHIGSTAVADIQRCDKWPRVDLYWYAFSIEY